MNDTIIDQIFKLKYTCTLTEETFFEQTSLSPADYGVIEKLDKDDRITATEFSQRLAVSISRGSRIITRMLNNGYLETIPSTEDRRRLMISLSARGLQTKQQINKMKEACNKKIMAELSEEELTALAENINKIIQVL